MKETPAPRPSNGFNPFNRVILIIAGKAYSLSPSGHVYQAEIKGNEGSGIIFFDVPTKVNAHNGGNLHMAKMSLIKAALETAETSQL